MRVFDRAPALIAILRGPEHIYEYVNDAYRASVRLAGETVIGSPFGLGQVDVAKSMRTLLDEIYASGAARRLPEVFVPAHLDLPERFYDILFQPIRNDDGAVEGILIQTIDITERVVAHRRLEASESRLRRIVEGSPIGLGFWGVDGHIVEANDALLRIVGHTRDELTAGKISWSERTAPEYRALDRRTLARFRAGEEIAPFEKAYVRPDGTRVPVLIGISRLSPQEGVAFVLDLTERKRSEEDHARLQAQLVQVQKLESLGVLAGGIAHDFNNLLTAILGGASHAQRLLVGDARADRALQHVVTGARRAADLTRQLLAYAGKARFDVRPIDLGSHVRELAELLETTISNRKVRLQLDLAHGLPAIEADVAQIQQVVMNLVVNAAEAIGDHGGTVLVSMETRAIDARDLSSLLVADSLAAGRYVVLSVRDDGAGMDDATRARIFDPFFTTKVSGRGLGLAAVLGIARSHRAGVRVTSAPGKGTTFEVFFRASERRPTQPRPAITSHFRSGGLALVIDDDHGVRRTLRVLLEDVGFEVIEAPNGRAGVEHFAVRAREIAVVLVDATMPELSGEETIREIRRLRLDVPIILSSGYDRAEALGALPSDAVASFLPKPFTPEELAQSLATALAKPTRDG